MNVGFIGLGHMGGAMAERLLDAGHELIVYNRTPQKSHRLVARGAVLEHAEHPGDLEGHLQRGRVAALLDRDDGLAGHPQPVRELRLRHLPVRRTQRADRVGEPGRLALGHGCYRPRR